MMDTDQRVITNMVELFDATVLSHTKKHGNLFWAKVTPVMARAWLAKSRKNRNVTEKRVAEYAAAMRAGKWVANACTIKFDAEGYLIDGQHRLLAVIKAGVPFISAIATGIKDPEAFATIDRGKTRNADQLLSMAGVQNSSFVAAIAKRVLAWELTLNKKNFTLNGAIFASITPNDVLAYGVEHADELNFMFREIRKAAVCNRCGAGTSFVAALVILYRVDSEATILFYEELKEGTNFKETSPVFRLKDRLMYPPDRTRGTIWGTEVMALTVKSFNYYVQNKPMKLLRWTAGGKNTPYFPVPGEGISWL